MLSLHFLADATFTCSPYSINTNTNSASQNYVSCYYTLSVGTSGTVTASMCSAPGSYSGDPFLRAYINGVQIAFNDDYCGAGSLMSFTMIAGQTVEIREGCYGSTYPCGGTVAGTVYIFAASPTNSPTPLPTGRPTPSPTPIPTLVPTPLPTKMPTLSPTRAPTVVPTYPPTVYPYVSNWIMSSAPTQGWKSISSSSDGTYLAAVQSSNQGYVYSSSNG